MPARPISRPTRTVQSPDAFDFEADSSENSNTRGNGARTEASPIPAIPQRPERKSPGNASVKPDDKCSSPTSSEASSPSPLPHIPPRPSGTGRTSRNSTGNGQETQSGAVPRAITTGAVPNVQTTFHYSAVSSPSTISSVKAEIGESPSLNVSETPVPEAVFAASKDDAQIIQPHFVGDENPETSNKEAITNEYLKDLEIVGEHKHSIEEEEVESEDSGVIEPCNTPFTGDLNKKKEEEMEHNLEVADDELEVVKKEEEMDKDEEDEEQEEENEKDEKKEREEEKEEEKEEEDEENEKEQEKDEENEQNEEKEEEKEVEEIDKEEEKEVEKEQNEAEEIEKEEVKEEEQEKEEKEETIEQEMGPSSEAKAQGNREVAVEDENRAKEATTKTDETEHKEINQPDKGIPAIESNPVATEPRGNNGEAGKTVDETRKEPPIVPRRPNKIQSPFTQEAAPKEVPPRPKPKPKPAGISSKIGQKHAALFSNLNSMLARGPPGMPLPAGANEEEAKPEPQETVEAAPKTQKLSMGRARGPKRRLPEETKVRWTTSVVPIWTGEPEVEPQDEAQGEADKGDETNRETQGEAKEGDKAEDELQAESSVGLETEPESQLAEQSSEPKLKQTDTKELEDINAKASTDFTEPQEVDAEEILAESPGNSDSIQDTTKEENTVAELVITGSPEGIKTDKADDSIKAAIAESLEEVSKSDSKSDEPLADAEV